MGMRQRVGIIVMAAVTALSMSGEVQAKGKKLQARAKRRAETPPIAFYLADYGNVKAETPLDVVKKCEAHRAKQRRETPPGTIKERPCAESVVVVRGPYRNLPASLVKDFGRSYNYRGSDGGWVDASGESPCFPAGTLVAMPRGARPIEALEVGDLVSSWDLEEDHIAVGRVERVKKRTATTIQSITLGHGDVVRATPNHPFFVADARAWVELGKIDRGATLLRLDGDRVTPDVIATKTMVEDEPTDVYDVTISPHRNLFANGVLVHNY